MRVLILLYLCIFFVQCRAPEVKYIDGVAISKDAKKSFLDKIQANEDKYSVIFLAGGFDSKPIKIYDKNNIFYNNNPKSDEILGLADAVRVLNNHRIHFLDEDSKYKFTLPKNKISKYKYIYITRDRYDEKYTIVYSNVLSGFR